MNRARSANKFIAVSPKATNKLSSSSRTAKDKNLSDFKAPDQQQVKIDNLTAELNNA